MFGGTIMTMPMFITKLHDPSQVYIILSTSLMNESSHYKCGTEQHKSLHLTTQSPELGQTQIG